MGATFDGVFNAFVGWAVLMGWCWVDDGDNLIKPLSKP
jgi:hypothetical protein